jgi:phospholipid/cholesterol/gamma-HCH transport system substrate-binding protein
MASFPFPKEAADLAKGDYANALFYMKFDLNKLFGTGGFNDSPNIPSPVEICMVTPAKPLCKKLSDSLLQQLCSLMPTNPLCPGVGPAPNGGSVPGLGDLGGLLGGLLDPTAGAQPSTTEAQPNTLLGLLTGLLGGGQ